MSPKVCLVGEFDKDPDEAMRKTAQEYAAHLDTSHDLLRINASEGYRYRNLRAIHSFDPDIIHFVPGPSILSFLYTKLVGTVTDSAVIHSAPLPAFYDVDGSLYYKLSHHSKRLIPLVKPDKLLAQSRSSREFFERYGVDCEYLFSGVSLDTYQPADEERKSELREKYDLPPDQHLTLHVGSLKEWRDVHTLPQIVTDETQLVVVGSTATQEEKVVKRYLEDEGAIVIHEYLDHIEEVYAAVDLYLFPTQMPVACCDVPLTVLEAMATNLPVVSTPFGGLPTMFEEGGGLFFGGGIRELSEKYSIAKDVENTDTRSAVEEYSWVNSTQDIDKIYEEVLHG